MAAAAGAIATFLCLLTAHLSPATFAAGTSAKGKSGKSLIGQPVTYGSAVSIRHVESKFYLFSAKISWGSGSGQQAVTAMPVSGSELDASQLWYVREGGQMSPRSAGEPVKCDDFIRLEHVTSNRNLHSHELPSPISQQYEVSAFGEDGEGDDGDNFQLVCSPGENWKIGEPVRLRHFYTGGYLMASRQKRFSRENCPRCPILGHLEVAVTTGAAKQNTLSHWAAEDGAILSHELGEGSQKPSAPKHSKSESSSESSVEEDL